MKNLTFVIIMVMFAPVAAFSQSEDTPTLYEWFFPDKQPGAQPSTIDELLGLQNEKQLTEKFKRKAQRKAARWKLKAQRTRERSERLAAKAKRIYERYVNTKKLSVEKDTDAMTYDIEAAKLRSWRPKE